MRIGDWSSDVCASDLRKSHMSVGTRHADLAPFERLAQAIKDSALEFRQLTKEQHAQLRQTYLTWPEDRNSVASGRSVSVSVDLGGRRIITQKTKQLPYIHIAAQTNSTGHQRRI